MTNDSLPFDLTVANEDGTANIYLDTANTVVVTATSDGTLVMDENSLLFIEFSRTLPPDAWKSAIVSAQGLRATLVSPERPTEWQLQPNDLPWTVPSSLVITLSGIDPATGSSPPSTSLTFSWEGFPKLGPYGRTAQLRILKSQSPQLADLDLNFGWLAPMSPTDDDTPQSVYVSEGEAQAISNNVSLLIQNPSSTAPVVVSPDGPQPRFWLTFIFVEAVGDPGEVDALCTFKEATDETQVTVQNGSSSWSAARAWDEFRNWQLTPPSNVLGPGEGVVIQISDIISYLPCFPTEMFINWADISGYKDGGEALPMQKVQAPPTIQTFSSQPSDDITAGEAVSLNWYTFGARIPGPVTIYEQDIPSNKIVQNGPAIGSVTLYPEFPVTYVIEMPDVQGVVPVPWLLQVEPVSISGLLVEPSKPIYEIGETVTLKATLEFANSYVIDPKVASEKDISGKTQVSVQIIVTRGSYIITAIGYGGPAIATWELPISTAALPCTLYMAMDEGIISIGPTLAKAIIVEVPPEAVTDICVWGGKVYWGRSDSNGVFFANLDGSDISTYSFNEPVISVCFSDQWYASVILALGSNGNMAWMVCNNLQWAQLTWNVAPVDNYTKMRTLSGNCFITANNDVFGGDLDNGPMPGTSLGAVSASALVCPPGAPSDDVDWVYYFDPVSGAIFSFNSTNASLTRVCKAQLSLQGNLIISGTGDLYWFEDSVGGGRCLWHCDVASGARNQVWWTAGLPQALTTDVSAF